MEFVEGGFPQTIMCPWLRELWLLLHLVNATNSFHIFLLGRQPRRHTGSEVAVHGGQRRGRLHAQPDQRLMATSLCIADAEDLPNILGINPIEAALIFGVLYYVYGSEVLYEYAREAGRLFSTYGPIVKDVSLDIFYEFRDYLEEDRERAALKMSGVDIDSIPRRTTNILEKFSETFATFSDLTTGKKEASELQEAYSGGSVSDATQDSETFTSPTSPPMVASTTDLALRRKSKRQVLLSRNVDVERIMNATDIVTRGEDLSTSGLSESISAVKDRFSALGAYDNNDNVGPVQLFPNVPNEDWDGQGENPFTNPLNEQAGVSGTSPTLSGDSTSANARIGPGAMMLSGEAGIASALGMSKFQQQMSGEWNTRVLRKDKYSGDGGSVAEMSQGGDYDDGGGGLTDSFLQKWERVSGSQEDTGNAAPSIPQEISSLDLPISPAMAGNSNLAMEVLQEIDRDYQRLRQRLVNLLQQEEDFLQQDEPTTVTIASSLADPLGTASTEPLMKKYWPPRGPMR